MPDYEEYDYEAAEAAGYALNGFRIAICVVGLFGNFIVMFMIFLSGDFKRAGIHWYVLQLAIADSLFLATLPLRVVETNDGWIFSQKACKMKNGVLYINYYNSILFLTAMAVDRYFAICHSFSERLSIFRSHRASYIITVIIWVTSMCLAFPVMLYSGTSMGDKCVCELHFPVDHREFCINEGFQGEMIDICAAALSESRSQGCNKRDGGYDYYDSGFGSGSADDTLALPEASTGSSLGNDTSDMNTTIEGFTSSKIEFVTTSSQVTNTTPYLATSTPVTVHDEKVTFQPGCSYADYEPGYIWFQIFNFAVMFVVPFMIITACYTRIVMKVRKSRFERFKQERSMSQAQKQEDETKRKVTIMCLMLVVVFVVCWLPFNAQEMAKMVGIHETESFCRNLKKATSIMVFANSAANPYIYMFGASFKKKVKRMRESRAGSAVYSFITLSSVFRRESTSSNPRSEEKRLSEGKLLKRESKVEETTPFTENV